MKDKWTPKTMAHERTTKYTVAVNYICEMSFNRLG